MSNIIKKEEYELSSKEKSDNENSEKYLELDGKKQNKIEDVLNGIENILENESNRNEQSTKDEDDLNELSLSNENDDKDYVNKEFIDLSFLDKSFSTEINNNENINSFENNIISTCGNDNVFNIIELKL